MQIIGKKSVKNPHGGAPVVPGRAAESSSINYSLADIYDLEPGFLGASAISHERISRPIPEVFTSVAGEVKGFLERLSDAGSIEAIEYLRDCYSESECPPINYNEYARPFAFFYFLENYWKAAFTFLNVPPPASTRRLLDVGSGSAANTLAYLAALDWQFGQLPFCPHCTDETKAKCLISVVLLDRSKAQLELAVQLLKLVQPKFRHLKIDVHTHLEDLNTWQPRDSSTDAVLLGHVLTENKPNIGPFLRKIWQVACENGVVYLIERPSKPDEVWDSIEKNLPYPPSMVPIEVGDIDEDIEDITPWPPMERQGQTKTRLTTRYLVLRVPPNKHLVHLLDLYFRAWKTKSPDLIGKVFSEEAEYHDKPFKPPILGIAGITNYWHKHVLAQHDIKLQVLSTVYDQGQAFAEWDATFEQHSRHVHLEGMLRLFLDRKSNKVAYLREYYRSDKRPWVSP